MEKGEVVGRGRTSPFPGSQREGWGKDGKDPSLTIFGPFAVVLRLVTKTRGREESRPVWGCGSPSTSWSPCPPPLEQKEKGRDRSGGKRDTGGDFTSQKDQDRDPSHLPFGRKRDGSSSLSKFGRAGYPGPTDTTRESK